MKKRKSNQQKTEDEEEDDKKSKEKKMSASRMAIANTPQQREKEKKDHTQSQNPQDKGEPSKQNGPIQANLIQDSQQQIISSRSNPTSRNVQYDSESQQENSVVPNISAGWNNQEQRGVFSRWNSSSFAQARHQESCFTPQGLNLREKVQKRSRVARNTMFPGSNIRFNLPSLRLHYRRLEYCFFKEKNEPRMLTHHQEYNTPEDHPMGPLTLDNDIEEM